MAQQTRTRPRAAAIALLALGTLSGCGLIGSIGSAPFARTSEARQAGTAANPYLWNASLDVLSFLPVRSADPRSGVIETGYGTPPGGTRAYRATVQVAGPALDARTLRLQLSSRSGPVDAATRQAVREAIFLRARQLRTAGTL